MADRRGKLADTATERTEDRRPGAREEARRQRREDARRLREEAYRRAKRQAAIRRAIRWGVAAAVIAAIVLFLLTRSQRAQANLQQANNFARTAGCGQIQQLQDRGREHLAPGEGFTYPSEPATSGPHDPSPLPSTPRVSTTEIQETRAVHNLEHGYVVIYYQPDGDGALPADVVRRLGGFATNHEKVLMAPMAALPSGTSLALVAWNRLETCPATVTAENAATVAKNFNDLFNSGGDAPEAGLP